MKIREVFDIEILDGEEEYPDQNAERRVSVLSERLTAFVRRVADRHSVSCQEEEAIVASVIDRLLAPILSRVHADLLSERLRTRNKT